MLNQQIGQYKIISKLGEGGMATVYLAEKGTLAKKVALKVLKDDFLSNRHIRGRFLSEARKMINLNHPNIVGVHDLIDDTDFVAIELDYIEGKTLKQHLQEKGALPDDEIEHLFKQMLDAVGYIHEKGFIHRDIKPSNFMLSENGIIKLTDFGIAKSVDDSNMDYTGTSTGMQMGTPKYMSPEQVRSTKDVDHRSDIYSLGVVLWEMVTGRVPYDIETESTFDVFEKIVREPLVLTDTKWDAVIQKATQKKADDRYANVGDVVWGKEGSKAKGLAATNLKKDNKIQTRISNNTNIIVLSVVGFVLLILIGLIIFQNTKGDQQKEVVKEQVETGGNEKNNKVNADKEEIDTEQKEISKDTISKRKVSDKTNDKEEISNDLKDTLSDLDRIYLGTHLFGDSRGGWGRATISKREGYYWVKGEHKLPDGDWVKVEGKMLNPTIEGFLFDGKITVFLPSAAKLFNDNFDDKFYKDTCIWEGKTKAYKLFKDRKYWRIKFSNDCYPTTMDIDIFHN